MWLCAVLSVQPDPWQPVGNGFQPRFRALLENLRGQRPLPQSPNPTGAGGSSQARQAARGQAASGRPPSTLMPCVNRACPKLVRMHQRLCLDERSGGEASPMQGQLIQAASLLLLLS